MSKIVIAIGLFFLAVIALYSYEDHMDKLWAARWQQFSVDHHCRVKQASSFWDARTLYSCDGVDIYH